MRATIAVAGEILEIEERVPLMDESGKLKTYPQEDDGVVEPLPLTAEETAQKVPSSEFSGYLGRYRK